MTKYKKITISNEAQLLTGQFDLFDKPMFKKINKENTDQVLCFTPYTDDNGAIEVSRVHEFSANFIIYSLGENSQIKEIFISTTELNLKTPDGNIIDINESNFDQILAETNYHGERKFFGNIKITSEEMIICEPYTKEHVATKVPNGVLAVYEIFDKSYSKNMSEEKSLFESLNKGEEHSWAHEDFAPEPPNIHFLYLNLE